MAAARPGWRVSGDEGGIFSPARTARDVTADDGGDEGGGSTVTRRAMDKGRQLSWSGDDGGDGRLS